MRFAYPLLWCLSKESQAELLGQISGVDAVPAPVMVEWEYCKPITFAPIPISQKDKEYIQAHLDSVEKIMRQPPSRSRR